MVVPMR